MLGAKINKSTLMLMIAFLVPLVLGLVFNLSPYIGFGFEKIPGDLGDTRFNIFILEHNKQFFLGETASYWGAGFMYPEAEVISLSDNLLGSAPFYTIFRIFGFSIFTSFQLWVIFIFILNYCASFLLAKYLTKDYWVAGLVAFIFAFSLSLSTEMAHAQTFPRYAIPLSILALLLWKDELHWKYFVAALTLFTYQMYCGIYLGFIFFVPFFVLLVIISIKKFKYLIEPLKKWKTIAGYGIGILVNVFLMFKLFAPYRRRATNGKMFSYEDINHSLPELKSYLSAHPGAAFHEGMANTIGVEHPAHWNHWIFPGWITFLGIILLGILGTVMIFIRLKSFSENQRLILVVGWITFLTFFRVGTYSFYSYVILLPGFSAMRSLTRVINIELLFFGLALVLGLYFFLSEKLKIRSILWAPVIMVLLVFDNSINPEKAHSTDKSEMVKRHNALVEKIDHLPEGAVVSYEPDIQANNLNATLCQIDAMLAAQALHLKSINGYSAKAANLFDLYWNNPNPENRRIWLSRFPDVDTTDIYVVH